MADLDDTGAPKRKVLKRLVLSDEAIMKDKALEAARTEWSDKQEAFTKARKEVTEAKEELRNLLAPRLALKGVADGVYWDFRENDDADIVVEIIERPKKSRSRVPTERM